MARGYSLLELIVALAIMGLIAAVAAPAVIGGIDRMTLNADARAVATTLRSLRETALDTQSDVAVTASTFELSSGTRIDLPKGGVVIVADGSTGAALQLTRGGAAVRIVVNRLTGRITVEDAP
jgi:prepilin-type N-terminal cleavage/methylation domain-containing protein